ncbi:MAG: hypothetical protein KJ732_00820 [Candidatus Margulisbacteria bacterium]|nr:hypothetical protein [Candidatus Margulisiibacteriota bacterium]
MIQVPHNKPHVPPPITPKEIGKEIKKTEDQTSQQVKAAPKAGIGRGPEWDSASIAVRLAALATEAKEKEVQAEDFKKILEEVVRLTGLKDPQAAMEAANERLQKEIEAELEKIKANKDLMEEADSWQKFGDLLAQMNQEQVSAFVELLQNEIRAL